GAETFVNGQPATWLPHLTVLATGNGEDDFYRFEITDAMLHPVSSSSLDDVKIVFDIDHGFEYGDPIVWASRLILYKGQFSNGTLTGATPVAYGPGWSEPTSV